MSRYTVYVTPRAWNEMKALPGNMRQRIRRLITDLATDPRPPQSQQLNTPQFAAAIWRVRVDRWRIVYTISEESQMVDVLAVRKRPPYDYGDLAALIEQQD
jgi:mRNA interferase RelE/StbE